MDSKPKYGDYVRVHNVTNDNISLVGTFSGYHGNANTTCLIDFKMEDSDDENGYTILTIIELDQCEFISDQEFFLWRLQGRGVGVRDVYDGKA